MSSREGDANDTGKSSGNEMELSRLQRVMRSDYAIVCVVQVTLMVDTILHSALGKIFSKIVTISIGSRER